MIAVSSHRPKASCSPEIWRNQLAAHKSWLSAFDRIFYFGSDEDEFHDDKTTSMPCDEFPRIEALAHFCSQTPGWSCIVNADIVLLPDTFRSVELELRRLKAASAMSFRFEFNPADKTRRIRNYDNGIDIFCATQPVWEKVCKKIPDWYRIGHCIWDTWMLGFFNLEGQPFYEFTGSRCVLHPKHGDRNPIHTVNWISDGYLGAATPPKLKISVQAGVDIRKAKENR
jgi:hypothetical protein